MNVPECHYRQGNGNVIEKCFESYHNHASLCFFLALIVFGFTIIVPSADIGTIATSAMASCNRLSGHCHISLGSVSLSQHCTHWTCQLDAPPFCLNRDGLLDQCDSSIAKAWVQFVLSRMFSPQRHFGLGAASVTTFDATQHTILAKFTRQHFLLIIIVPSGSLADDQAKGRKT
jgi:hypothetical protein